MRRLEAGATPTSPIWDLWTNGTNQLGENRANAIVTVEPDWFLNKTTRQWGNSKRGPFRWYQRQDNSQTEVQIPNVKSIQMDRSIDTDAGNCVITIINSYLDFSEALTLAGQLGDPGHFSWARGASDEGEARWGHVANEWADVLIPNALIRTYQGYGGHDLTLEEAVDAGNLVLTGVWLVDAVNIDAQQQLVLNCRDMAKMLIEQVLYKPLVPNRLYPLRYCRWYRKDFDSSFSARPTAAALTAASTTSAPSGSVKMTYRHSSADAWYDYDANIHGHRGTDSVDGRQETYALSVGNSHPSKIFCTDFFEYEPAGPVEWIYIHPWGGNYETYISIKEGGRWLGEERVPYDHTPLVGTQPVAIDTLADEFYVLKTSVPWETGTWIRLPRRFNAQRVRVTFRNHTKSEWGPWFYRCGIREIQGGIGAREDRSSSGTTKGVSHIPWTFGGAIFRDDDSELEEGYYVIDESGRLFAFGDARTLPQTGGGGHDDFTVAMRSWHNGAWSLQQNGRVQAYGSVEHYGDAADEGRDDFIDMAPTNTGEGYYLLARDGVVFGYGDALLYGDASPSGDTFDERAYTGTGIETHPVENGYWIVDGDGIVQDFGDVPSHGSVSPYRTGMEEHAWVRAIRRNQDGDGYWLLSGDGNVYAKGACEHFGELDDALKRDDLGAEGFRKLCWDFFPTNTDQGYYILQADGTILYYGDAEYFGQPGGYGIMRSPGNYCADEETEMLTKRGWLRYDEVRVGDETLAINPATNASEWTAVESVFRRPVVDEPMIRIESKTQSSLTTPDHKWYVTDRGGRWKWKTTQSLSTADYIPHAMPRFDSPTLPTFTDAYVELIGWFWTEGCLSDGRPSLSQSLTKNPKNAARIQALLEHLYGPPGRVHPSRTANSLEEGWGEWSFFDMSNGVRQFKLSKRLFGEFLPAIDPSNKALLPAFLCQLTQSQLDLLIQTSLDADGHRPQRRHGKMEILTQGNEARIRGFEMACVLAGRAVSTTQTNPTGDSEMWSTTLLQLPLKEVGRKPGFQHAESYSGVIWCPTLKHHNWLARRNGKVYFTGNSDYSDIVREILLWSGWLFYGDDEPNEKPPVYGNIETTGAYADECIGEDLFDKKHPIDVINELKEIVGYIAWCDDEGAYRFESPNFWKIGNFYDDGEFTDFIPEIDERLSLTAYSVSFDDTNARSQVIIASQLPEKADRTTVTTRYTPATVGILRGMTKPAIWVNGVFTNPDEQRIMAELIGMHIWFSTRIGRVTCYANPGIQINDQVRIFERQTAETYIHYIRAISTNHDLLTGEYTMSLETNWLGDQDSWIITADNIPDAGESGLVQWRISEQLMEWLEHVESNAVTIARLSGFDVVDGPTSFSDAVVAGDAGEDGAANAE